MPGTLHWVPAAAAVPAEVRLYDHLFHSADPAAVITARGLEAALNPAALEVLTGCLVEPGLSGARPGDRFQFLRHGYFCVDPDSAAGELVSGRMMYDIGHWQSEISVLPAQGASRTTGRLGGWPGAPDYSALPSALRSRSQATDPIWPLRSPNKFYLLDYYAEYLSKPNLTLEDLDPDLEVTRLGPSLDTLYNVLGGPGSGLPVMTLYHGSENAPFVFSGFPLWFFRRPQAVQLADWVLQQLWHLPRDPVGRGVEAAPADQFGRPAPADPFGGPAPRPRAP